MAGTIGGVAFEDEDILAYDTRSSEWSIYFDASTEGVTTNVDAFALLYDQSILLSFSIPVFVPDGVGTVDDSDIVKFSPITGQFSLYRSAAQMGLNPLDENQDVDTIAFSPSPGSKLLISTRGPFNGYEDADLLMINLFQPPLLSFYFDGSDVGLTDVGTTDAPEGVEGAWVDGTSGQIYLSTKGAFSVSGANGDGSDVFVCAPGNTGTNTSCTFGWEPGVGLFWNGSAHGIGAYQADGFSIGAVPLPSDCSQPLNCSFEEITGSDFDHWNEQHNPPYSEWVPSTDSQSGYYSVRLQVQDTYAGQIDQPIYVDPDKYYRISFYSKASQDFTLLTSLRVMISGYPTFIYDFSNSTAWVQHTPCFYLPSDVATPIIILFMATSTPPNQNPSNNLSSFFLDEVSLEEIQPGQCPP